MKTRLLLPHEHIFCRFRRATPTTFAALNLALAAAHRSGVRGIVDLTPYGPIRPYADILQNPALPRIFGCVGFYRPSSIDQRHRVLGADALVDVMHRQLKTRRSAGLNVVCVKVASDGDELSALERRVMQAAALFATHEALPIVTHSIRGRHAQFRALTASGANPGRIMLSHVEMDLRGRYPRYTPTTLTTDVIPLLREGATLCITDLPVSPSSYRSAVLRFIDQLCEQGFSESLNISGDARFRANVRGVSFSRRRDYATVPDRLLPLLQKHLGSPIADSFVSSNPLRFYGLTW